MQAHWLVAQLLGVVFGICGLILTFRRKTYIDLNTRRVQTEVELPGGFKLKTQSVLVAILFFAVVLTLFPIYKERPTTGLIKGTVLTSRPLKIYAVAAEMETRGDIQLEVPATGRYNVVYLPSDGINSLTNRAVDLSQNNPAELPKVDVTIVGIPTTLPTPTSPRKESASVVAEFK